MKGRRLIPLPAASYHELVVHCAYPWTSGKRWPWTETSPAGRYGIAFHEAAALLSRGETPELGAIAERNTLLPGDFRRLEETVPRIVELLEGDLGVRREAEVELLYDVVRGRARRGPRSERTDSEIYGAADLLVWRQDGVLVVRDWKTGRRAKEKRPSQTRQLRALALAAGLVEHAEVVRVELAFVDEDGAELVGEDLDALELGAIEGELAELLELVDAPPVPRPGPWCERYYCPLRAVCPATVAALAQVDVELAAAPLTGEFSSPEHAAAVRHRLPVLQAVIEHAQEQLEAYAKRHGPLPVVDRPGVVWGPVEHDGRERIEPTPAALEVVRQRLGEASAEAIECSVSKASLERGVRSSLGPQAKRGAAGRAMKELLEELRAIKAVKRGARYTKFEEFKRLTERPSSVDEEPASEPTPPAPPVLRAEDVSPEQRLEAQRGLARQIVARAKGDWDAAQDAGPALDALRALPDAERSALKVELMEGLR
jgi:hypothetical protein